MPPNIGRQLGIEGFPKGQTKVLLVRMISMILLYMGQFYWPMYASLGHTPERQKLEAPPHLFATASAENIVASYNPSKVALIFQVDRFEVKTK